MEEKQRGWQSISSTVKRDFYEKLEKLAAQEGIKIGSLVRRAVRAYCSNEVQCVSSSMKVDIESLIKQSVLLFQRVNAGKQEQGLRDRVARLEIWIEKLFFHLSGRNEGLMTQMRSEVERKMHEFYKDCQREEDELRKQIAKVSPLPTDAGGSGVSTEASIGSS